MRMEAENYLQNIWMRFDAIVTSYRESYQDIDVCPVKTSHVNISLITNIEVRLCEHNMQQTAKILFIALI